uniref:Uncharacterized protein n=1 Tax=Arundo donax TaxID=35708 RepID=A0A0A8XRR7_ARUDO
MARSAFGGLVGRYLALPASSSREVLPALRATADRSRAAHSSSTDHIWEPEPDGERASWSLLMKLLAHLTRFEAPIFQGDVIETAASV